MASSSASSTAPPPRKKHSEMTAAELKEIRPKMGKIIICERQARNMEGRPMPEESFLNDKTIDESSRDDYDDRSFRPRPTMEQMRARNEENLAERRAENERVGQTGKWVPYEERPKMSLENNWKAPDISLSESESDKENVSGMEEEAEHEEEKGEEEAAEETTPIAAAQRVRGRQSVAAAKAAPQTGTPPGRPPAAGSASRAASGRADKRPSTTAPRTSHVPPVHQSTPKVTRTHIQRPSLEPGVPEDISIIANSTATTAMLTGNGGRRTISSGEHTVEAEAAAGAGGAERRASTVSMGVVDDEVFLDEQPQQQNEGTFVVVEQREAEEEGRRQPAGRVRVEVTNVVARRSFHDVTMRSASGEADDEGEEEAAEEGGGVTVAVAGVSLRRSMAPAAEGAGRRGWAGRVEEEDSESMEVEDVEMHSFVETPPRRRPSTAAAAAAAARPGKRASMEHPLDDTSSPMAVAVARRTSGQRDAMVRPKISVTSSHAASSRASTGSSTSSIAFENVSDLSVGDQSAEGSFVDPKTPTRTPRTNRLLRQSLAARAARQSTTQPRLAILEEADRQGGESGEEEREGEEEEGQEENEAVSAAARPRAEATAPATTPITRKLSQRLQSSVDRLSQPRHSRHSEGPRACARDGSHHSPGRAATPQQRPSVSSSRHQHHHHHQPAATSPAPPTRRHTAAAAASTTMNQTRIGGYTPTRAVDTTMMEDAAGGAAKSGMAPRIKRNPLRGQARAPLMMEEEEEEKEDEQERQRRAGEEARRRATRYPALLYEEEEQEEEAAELSRRRVQDQRQAQRVDGAHAVGRNGRHEEAKEHDNSVSLASQHMEHTPITSPFEARGRRRRGEEEEEEAEDGMMAGGGTSFNDDYGGNYDDQNDSMGGGRDEDEAVFARPHDPPSRRSTVASSGDDRAGGRSTTSDMDGLSTRASHISIGDDDDVSSSSGAAASRRRQSTAASAAAASVGGGSSVFGSSPSARSPLPATPKTPFRRTVARNADLFSTDTTPGVHSLRSMMDTSQEEQWAAEQPSRLWRGDESTASDENDAYYPPDESQLENLMDDSQQEEEEENDDDDDGAEVDEPPATEAVLAPRKLIQPTASPGVRRSTRTRMKPVRTWLGETARYVASPSGGSRLVGVSEVVVRDKLFVKTGTADIARAMDAKKKTERQRRLAAQKRKTRKANEQESEEESE